MAEEALFPAFWRAATGGLVEDVEKMILEGADVEERGGRWKLSLLHHASLQRPELVKILLENGSLSQIYLSLSLTHTLSLSLYIYIYLHLSLFLSLSLYKVRETADHWGVAQG